MSISWRSSLKKSLKIASMTVVLLLLLVVGVLAYGKPQAVADEERGCPPDNRPPDNRPPDNRPPKECPPIVYPSIPRWNECRPKLGLFSGLLANATPIEINGTVVALVRDMLVLDTEDDQIRIHLPPVWTLEYEVMEREELFNSTFSAAGENVTVKALKAVLFENDGFSINVMMGYEIINADSVHAYAVLPFNIEVES